MMTTTPGAVAAISPTGVNETPELAGLHHEAAAGDGSKLHETWEKVQMTAMRYAAGE